MLEHKHCIYVTHNNWNECFSKKTTTILAYDFMWIFFKCVLRYVNETSHISRSSTEYTYKNSKRYVDLLRKIFPVFNSLAFQVKLHIVFGCNEAVDKTVEMKNKRWEFHIPIAISINSKKSLTTGQKIVELVLNGCIKSSADEILCVCPERQNLNAHFIQYLAITLAFSILASLV